ncbi:MAG TPA: DDE-type integrase/transposase/recombinase [Polyangiales bacterium]
MQTDLCFSQLGGEVDPLRQEVALFRYGLISELTQLQPNHRGLYKLLTDKADREYNIPGTLRRRVAAETIRGWLRDYRSGGFDALMPKVRRDHGSTRTIPTPVVDLLCQLKDDEPGLSIPLLLKKVRAEHPALVSDELPLPLATVHRLLSRRGLMKKRPEEPTSNDRRHFQYEDAGDLWMSDVMYGPKLRVDSRMRQSYLIGFIDDATRVVPYASFTLSEGTVAYLPALEHGIRRRGLPKRLYVDNGSAFRSRHLALVCAKLGIALIHAKPYSPQGKGKMERWFRTVRMQLLPTLTADNSSTLSALNRTLSAWIEGEYHHAPHRGLGDITPASAWACRSESVRMPGSDLADAFLFEQRRKVNKDRTVTLDGVAFEVDAALVGENVVLRYSPEKSPAQRSVEVWHQGKRVEIAKLVDALANCFVKRNASTRNLQLRAAVGEPVAKGLSLRELVDPSADLDDEDNF